MRMMLICFTLAIACSGLVKAAGDGELFIPSVEDTSNASQGNRWNKNQHKTSYRSSAGKRSSAVADRNDAAAGTETEKDDNVASANDSAQPWTIVLLALAGLAVTSISAFFAIRAWQARTAGHDSRDRSSASAFLAASLVQTQMRSDEALEMAHQEEKKTRRAA